MLSRLTKNSCLSFLFDTCQEINIGIKEKNSIDFVIKLKEDDWLFERSITTCDQPKSFKLKTNSFGWHKFDLHDLM